MSLYTSPTTSVLLLASGAPLSPPSSSLATPTSPSLEVVVLDTITPSTLEPSASSTSTTSATSAELRSGESLTSMGGLWGASLSLAPATAPRRPPRVAPACRALRPGVLGEDTLITR